MHLQVIHKPDTSQNESPQFAVMCGGKASEAVTIASPWEIIVGKRTLKQGLHWYLESYLELPITNYRDHADEILTALSNWGKSCFDKLFSDTRARGWYRDMRQKGLSGLRIEIVSDDADVLSWPWEALESRDDGILALQCQIGRRLNIIGDVRPIAGDTSASSLNILYVIARPHGDNDVGYQTMARPMVDFAESHGWPAHINVLRPPTFDQLRKELKENEGFYHIVHFDGHGSLGSLVFEKDGDGGADAIPAHTLGNLLRQHNIPVMVLNACQSATQDDDPFASVAVSLLKAGVRGVAAMSYSLWVSGAKVFVPAFYRNLFKNGSIASAMQDGRREMFRNKMRNTFTGQIVFNDWMVPVLYQQDAEGILPALTPGGQRESKLPYQARDKGDYGFIGRERAILKLERGILRNPAGILIHGMAGEGKTTLAKGFLRWLESTNGLESGAFWFSFEDIHSAEYIINTLLEAVNIRAEALSTEQKMDLLTSKLRQTRFFIVWDNFESASGIPGTEVSALMPEEDRVLLKQFLNRLRGGETKVIITSRTSEDWLSLQECFRLTLGGLEGEGLWEYCSAVVADLGLAFDRECKVYKALMDKLEGNPLATRAILLRLKERPAQALLAELEDELKGMDGDDATNRIQAALAVFERGLNPAFAPALRLLGLHEHFADKRLISQMLGEAAGDVPLNDCFAALESAGLCRHDRDGIYQLHPALRGCLARLYPAFDVERRGFVGVMGSLADTFTPKPLHEQRYVFTLFSANFHRALKLARELSVQKNVLALTQGLASYAKNTRSFLEAERLYNQLAEASKEHGNTQGEAVAYHQLGMVAEERRDFDTAEDLYKKSLAIKLEQGDEYGAAATYHQLGSVASERQDFDIAEGWFKESLTITLKLGIKHGEAFNYHNLGIVSAKRRDFDTAEDWYKKSLAIKLKQGNEHNAATTYHQLGNVAYERQDFDAAENWYKESLTIKLKQGYEYGTASTYGQLGMVAQERQDFDTAKKYYLQALAIFEKFKDRHSAEITKRNLELLDEESEDNTNANP